MTWTEEAYMGKHFRHMREDYTYRFTMQSDSGATIRVWQAPSGYLYQTPVK